MTVNSQVSYKIENNIGIITINYPPVNALSQMVRQGLIAGIELFESNDVVNAIVIECADKTFIAGADIKEFAKAATEPFLPDVVNRIEAANKPVIAAMFGTVLGGGFEVALACHYRVALKSTKVGLPEVNLGLIPGAGGTQRLPRIIGAKRALEMVTSGTHFNTQSFSETNLFDALFENEQDLHLATINFVNHLIESQTLKINRVGDNPIDDSDLDWQAENSRIIKNAKGKEAPVIAANVLFSTKNMTISEGMLFERKEFLKLRESEQSAALRYAFSAEKLAAKTNLTAEALSVKEVGIIGGGNMGSGIATAFLAAGFVVQLIEQNDLGLDAGITRIKNNFASNVKRGGITQENADTFLSNLRASTDYQTLTNADLVIEAVFEDLQVKQELFRKLDEICRADCVLATNTSYLDINEMAKSLSRPEQLIGMHFFSPANIMKLLEIVKANESSEQVLATAMAVAKKLNKISVLVGVCFGFAGNRMYTRYGREIQQMLLEGANIEQIDQAMTEWGMAMGPLAVQDMSGIDIGHNARSAQPFPEYDPGYFRAAAVLVENGRLGRKTSKGFYRYDETGIKSSDPQATLLIKNKAKQLAISQREFTNHEISQRALLALISEGLSLIKENIVERSSDIDVVWLHGYGFPRFKGGPMFQAKQMGADKVSDLLKQYRKQYGVSIWPVVEVSYLQE